MPDANPYVPGDDIYEQYDLTRTFRIKSGVAITKGHIYVMDGNGYLVVPAADSGNVTVVKGYFQAKDSVAAVTYTAAADAPTVQCLCPGSFMVLYAPANAVEGDAVQIAGAAAVADQDKVAVSTAMDIYRIGRIFRILQVDSDENRKYKTADDDVIVVRTGVV